MFPCRRQTLNPRGIESPYSQNQDTTPRPLLSLSWPRRRNTRRGNLVEYQPPSPEVEPTITPFPRGFGLWVDRDRPLPPLPSEAYLESELIVNPQESRWERGVIFGEPPELPPRPRTLADRMPSMLRAAEEARAARRQRAVRVEMPRRTDGLIQALQSGDDVPSGRYTGPPSSNGDQPPEYVGDAYVNSFSMSAPQSAVPSYHSPTTYNRIQGGGGGAHSDYLARMDSTGVERQGEMIEGVGLAGSRGFGGNVDVPSSRGSTLRNGSVGSRSRRFEGHDSMRGMSDGVVGATAVQEGSVRFGSLRRVPSTRGPTLHNEEAVSRSSDLDRRDSSRRAREDAVVVAAPSGSPAPSPDVARVLITRPHTLREAPRLSIDTNLTRRSSARNRNTTPPPIIDNPDPNPVNTLLTELSRSGTYRPQQRHPLGPRTQRLASIYERPPPPTPEPRLPIPTTPRTPQGIHTSNSSPIRRRFVETSEKGIQTSPPPVSPNISPEEPSLPSNTESAVDELYEASQQHMQFVEVECTCPICKCLMAGVVILTDCGHAFCGGCILEMIRSGVPVPSCPSCRRRIGIWENIRCSPLIQNIITNLVACRRLDPTWTGADDWDTRQALWNLHKSYDPGLMPFYPPATPEEETETPSFSPIPSPTEDLPSPDDHTPQSPPVPMFGSPEDVRRDNMTSFLPTDEDFQSDTPTDMRSLLRRFGLGWVLRSQREEAEEVLERVEGREVVQRRGGNMSEGSRGWYVRDIPEEGEGEEEVDSMGVVGRSYAWLHRERDSVTPTPRPGDIRRRDTRFQTRRSASPITTITTTSTRSRRQPPPLHLGLGQTRFDRSQFTLPPTPTSAYSHTRFQQLLEQEVYTGYGIGERRVNMAGIEVLRFRQGVGRREERVRSLGDGRVLVEEMDVWEVEEGELEW